ncbi:hypothetical protein F441_04630 [Phytophthora nicotianae CJ01A1]|nr:hypothetical protein F441_04630 [Phytophthora nicotianae CJ01A1]
MLATASRGFASGVSNQKTPSKWPKRLRITVAVGSYLLQETPESKKARLLSTLATENVKKGDFDVAIKYYSSRPKPTRRSCHRKKNIRSGQLRGSVRGVEAIRGRTTILPGSHEESHRREPHKRPLCRRLEYYGPHGALLPPNVRPDPIMYFMVFFVDSKWSRLTGRGRHETADKMLKKAIRLYEKYRGEFSESSSSVLNDRVVAKLDGASIPVLLGYVQLLASMKRDNEVVDMRQRVTQIVCDSMAIRSLETTVLDKFDDLVALNAIQKEHRRERDYDGHSM